MAQASARALKRLSSCLCAARFPAASAVLALAVMSAPSGAQVEEHVRRSFYISARPLVDALEEFSSTTGIELFYDSGLVHGRQSAEVRGLLPPEDALRIMLKGSPLSARPIAGGAITILAREATAAALGPMPEQSVYQHYFALIQSELAKSFCSDELLRRADYRAVVRFRIDPRGRLGEMRPIGTTGNGVRDKAIAGALYRMRLGLPPPVDLPQPIVIVVLPRSEGRSFDCRPAE